MGAAESGVGAAILGKLKGYDVFVSDKAPIAPAYKQMLEQHQIAFEEGTHTESIILTANEVVKSPGIPEKAPIIAQIRAANIPIVSEIEFGSRYTSAKIIAITGTNGKTTTTSLTYHVLEQAGLKVALAGNIGYSLALHIATQPSPDYYVVEVSSFQLDDTPTFCPHIAVLTNITPDHLDRYNYSFEQYVVAKFKITAHQSAQNYFIYGADDAIIRAYLLEHNATIAAHKLPFAINNTLSGSHATLEKGNMIIKSNIGEKAVIPLSALPIKGKHNTYNALCACAVAHLLGVSASQIEQGLSTFQAIEHRLEPVAVINNISFINDSKATNIDSTWYALDAMTEPTVWIAGGTDKGNDYSTLLDLVTQKVKAIVCMCVDDSKIKAAYQHLRIPIVYAPSAKQAVQAAYGLAHPNDVVLLSPACASFDLFKNYEDRGRQFKQAVLELM